MSLWMNEHPYTYNQEHYLKMNEREQDDFFDKVEKEWKDWAKDKEVCMNGICDKYIKKGE